MRWIPPRPLLLALTLVLVIGAIVLIEFRLDAGGASTSAAGAQAESQPKPDPQTAGKPSGETAAADEGGEQNVSGPQTIPRIHVPGA